MKLHSLVGVLLLLILAAPAGASDFANLNKLFEQWRAFERPPLLDGAPDYTAARFEERQAGYLMLRRQLDQMETSGWPIPRRVDWHLLRAEMNGYDFNRRVLRPWARDPAFYRTVWMERSDVPAHEGPSHHALLEFWSYQFPLDEAARKRLAAELAVIPPLYDQARRNLTGNARELWIAGIRTIRDQLADLDAIAERTRGYGDAALDVAIGRARSATADFAAWLEAQAPGKDGPSGIGRAQYTWYQQNVHLVPMTWEGEVVLLQRELDRAGSSLKLEEHRNRNLPALEPVRNETEYAKRADLAATALIRFLREQDIVTVADYFEPALREHLEGFVPEDKRNYFRITMHLDPTPLFTHNWHWFEKARMEREPNASPLRRGPLLYNIFDSRSEGTATGLEEMLMHAGLYDASPRSRELVWILFAQRAARGFASLHAQANEMTLEEAGGVAMKSTPRRDWMKVQPNMWTSEQHVYLRQPGYGTSYITGKYLLERTLADWGRLREEQGKTFSLRAFFDALLACGDIPISLARWELTGRDDEIRYLMQSERVRVPVRAGRAVNKPKGSQLH